MSVLDMDSSGLIRQLSDLQQKELDLSDSSRIDQASQVNYCMQRVKDAEEALAEVRQALEKVSMSNPQQAFSQFTNMRQSHEPSSQPALVEDMEKKVFGNTSSGILEGVGGLAGQFTASMGTAPVDSGLGSITASVMVAPSPVDELGGLEAVAGRFHIDPSDVEKCQRAFVGMDVEKTGTVSAVELDILLERVCGMKFSTAEIETIIAKFDKEHDGDLTFEEFLLFYCETPIHRVMDLNTCISKVSRDIRAHMEEDRMSPHEIVHGVGIPAKVARSYLQKEIEEASACLQLPVAAFLLACFLVSVFWHMRIEELHAVDTAISQDLLENANFAFGGAIPYDNGRMGHKNLHDVNSFPDFWSWLTLGVVPLIWPDGSWGSSEARSNTLARCVATGEALEFFGWNKSLIPDKSQEMGCPEGDDPPLTPEQFWRANFSSYLYFHNILGGVRMSQEETIDQPCPNSDSELIDAVHPATCLSVPGKHWLVPEFANTLQDRRGSDSVRDVETQYLLSRSSQHKILKRLRGLENEGWLNPRTAKVEIMITTYNPHMDILTATYLLFFLNRGGHIHKLIEPVSVWLTPYHGWWNYLADSLWCFTVLAIMIYECIDLGSKVCAFGLRRGFRHYIDWSNAVDWFSIFYSFIIMYLWSDNISRMRDLRSLIKRADPEVVGSWTDENDRILFYEIVKNVMIESHSFRAVLAWYPFAIVSRLFKAFAYQPRLAMVTNTMYQASGELVHFGLVFGSIFVIYATSAMIVFGQELLAFATFGRAIASTFRVLMGDFDWEEMAHVGRVRANIWFVTFMLLVNFIMLNMLLAIVMDVYTEVKGSLGADAESLWSQAYEIYIRFRETHFGEHLYLGKILKHVENDYEDALSEYAASLEKGQCMKFYTVDSLCERVPGLPADQAKSILLAAHEMQEARERSSSSLSDMGRSMASMKSTLWTIHEALQNVFHIDEMIARLLLNASEVAGRSLNGFKPQDESNPEHQASSRSVKDPKDSTTLRDGDLTKREVGKMLKQLTKGVDELRETTKVTHGLLHKQASILHRAAPGTREIEGIAKI